MQSTAPNILIFLDCHMQRKSIVKNVDACGVLRGPMKRTACFVTKPTRGGLPARPATQRNAPIEASGTFDHRGLSNKPASGLRMVPFLREACCRAVDED